MMHYTELAESKGIVLMVGEYDKDVLVSVNSLFLSLDIRVCFIKPCSLVRENCNLQHFAAVKLGIANLLPTHRDPNYSFNFQTK